MLVRKKHLRVIVEKTWKRLAQFRTAEKVKAGEAVLFLLNAVVGCPISERSLSCGCVHIDTKAGVPFSWARCPRTQKESLCSKAFRVEISKMPEVLQGESLVVPLGAQSPLGHPKPEEGSPSLSSILGNTNQPRQPAGPGRAHSSAPPGSLWAQGEWAGCFSHHPSLKAEDMTRAPTLPEPHGPALPGPEASFLSQAC